MSMLMRGITLVVLVAVLSSSSAAQGTGTSSTPVPVPPFVLRGLEQLQRDSADAAIGTWTATWTAPGDVAKAQVLRESMRQLRELAGLVQGCEIVKVEAVGTHLRRAYVLFRYPTQPIFAQFVVYGPQDVPAETDWKLVTVTWNTNPAEAWPPTVWVR